MQAQNPLLLNLLNHNNQETFAMIDQVYAQVVVKFRQLNLINFHYAGIRTVLSAAFLLGVQSTNAGLGMQAWLTLAVLQGIIASLYYHILINSTRNNQVILYMGNQLYHTYFISKQQLEEMRLPQPNTLQFDTLIFPTFDFNSPGQEESRASYTVLMLQLQFQANRLSKSLQLLSVFQFSMFYSLQIFGVFLYMTGEVPVNSWLDLFFKAFMIIALYLFIEIYILFLISVVVVPLLGMFFLYTVIVRFYKRKKLERSLKPHPAQTAGVCPICISEYKQAQGVIKLACGHQFHQNCLSEWIKRSLTCPNCRYLLM